MSRTRSWAVAAVVLLALVLAAALVLALRPDSAVDAAPADSPTSSERPDAEPEPGATSDPEPGATSEPDAMTDAEPEPGATPEPTPPGAAESPPGLGPSTTPDPPRQGRPGQDRPGDDRPAQHPPGQDEPEPAAPTPDVSLRWDGPIDGSLTVSGRLWGEVIVVPGDSGSRTVTVRNDGPTAGTLTASIVNATAFRDPDHPDWVDDTFYDDLTINGIPASALEGTKTPVHEVELARGETTEIPLSYAFDGWSGNRTGGGMEEPTGVIVNPDGVGPRVFTFDVLLRITGDTQAGTPGAHQSTGVVAHTGGAVLPRSPWLLLAAAVLTLVAAGMARALRRAPEEAPNTR